MTQSTLVPLSLEQLAKMDNGLLGHLVKRQKQIVQWLRSASELVLFRYALLFATAEGYHDRRELFFSQLRPGYKGYNVRQDGKDVPALFGLSDADLVENAREQIVKWVASKFEGYHPMIDPRSFDSLAAAAKIDIKPQWPTTCKANGSTDLEDYLAILNKSQVIDLIAEWKLTIKYTDSTKRSELVDQVAKEGLGKPTPKLLLNAKEVSLT